MTITGNAAIEIARIAAYDGGPNLLNKYADPIEGERLGLTIAEAEEVATEDPSLIWMDATVLRDEAAAAGDLDFVAAIDAA